MKHPCPACKRVHDDGLPCPPGITPEQYSKSHKYCPECAKKLNEWLDNYIKENDEHENQKDS